MNGSPERQRAHSSRRLPAAAAVLIGWLALPPGARGATWKQWWLPDNFSVHGSATDWMFNVIFWITMTIFVGVEILLVYFAVKYRYQPARRKGIFSHGNTRVEMVWTIVPAIILLWISLATINVWDEYRFGNANDQGRRTEILVVGEQFKWNVVYPGPDGKLGKYLAYPKTTDPKYNFKPHAQAVRDVEIDLRGNPLGQSIDKADANDPGKDDDYSRQPGRPVIVPEGRPLEIALSAKDVLHSFFLPNFRVKLDAVPGLRGLIFFTATQRSTAEASIDSVPADKMIWLDHDVPGVVLHGSPKAFKIFDPNDKQKNLTRRRVWMQSLESLEDVARKRLLREKVAAEEITGDRLAAEVTEARADLKALGVDQVSYVERPFEIVCEELCGLGHYTMRGDLIVVSGEQYDGFLNREALAEQAKSADRAKPAGPPLVSATGPAEPATAPTMEPAAAEEAATAEPATAPTTEPAAAEEAATAEPATPPTAEPAVNPAPAGPAKEPAPAATEPAPGAAPAATPDAAEAPGN